MKCRKKESKESFTRLTPFSNSFTLKISKFSKTSTFLNFTDRCAQNCDFRKISESNSIFENFENFERFSIFVFFNFRQRIIESKTFSFRNISSSAQVLIWTVFKRGVELRRNSILEFDDFLLSNDVVQFKFVVMVAKFSGGSS